MKRARRRTGVRREPLFADNAVPLALQPTAAERSFEMGSTISSLLADEVPNVKNLSSSKEWSGSGNAQDKGSPNTVDAS